MPVVSVGATGSQGVVEITDIIFSTVGPGMSSCLSLMLIESDCDFHAAAGAIVVEWNVQQPSGNSGGAGMWDSHIR